MGNNLDALTLRARAHELLASNNLQEANEILSQLVELQPDDAEMWHYLGWTFSHLGDIQSAITHYQKAASIAPQSIGTHYDLAMVLGQYGDIKHALRHLKQVLDLDPNHIDARVKLSYIIYLGGDTAEAMSHLQKVKKINPEHLEMNLRLGTIYLAMNDFAKARNCFKTVLRQNSDHEEAISQLASLYAYSGEAEKAYQMLAPLLRSRPVSISAANTLAIFCRPLGRCQEAIEILEERLAQKPMTNEDESRISFSLGKLYDGIQEYRKAFEHFDRGNKLSDKFYDPWEEKRWIQEIVKQLNNNFFKQVEHAKHISKRIQPVFIVGLPRSGTSLTEQILSCHPAVSAAGERLEISQLASSICEDIGSQQGYPFCLLNAKQSSLNGMAKRYIKDVTESAGSAVKVVTDKMPDNYQHLGLIQLLFPKAKIIHCVRNPMDTCLSGYFNKLLGRDYSYNLTNLGRHYRLYEEMMTHWKNVLPLSILDVHYEDLVDDQERMSRKIVEFCGLKWDKRCLNFHKSKRNVVTASTDQVRQPIYRKSVERWKNYEEYLGELREALDKRI